MGPEKLGRLAPSLQSLPTVIWHSRLEEYVDRSLADIRSLKTHGEKRVNAILEVFCTVHEALATATLQENIDVVVVPRFIPPLTRWLMEAVAQPELPPVDELHQHIVKPMVRQIKIDLGDQVAGLAAARLRLDDNAPSRQAAGGNDRRHAGPRLPVAGRLRKGDGSPLAGRPLAARAAGHPFRRVRSGNDRPGARHHGPVLPGRQAGDRHRRRTRPRSRPFVIETRDGTRKRAAGFITAGSAICDPPSAKQHQRQGGDHRPRDYARQRQSVRAVPWR